MGHRQNNFDSIALNELEHFAIRNAATMVRAADVTIQLEYQGNVEGTKIATESIQSTTCTHVPMSRNANCEYSPLDDRN